MDEISEIFVRADIQQIREFLLHGVECTQLRSHSYKERIEMPMKKLNERLHEIYPNESEREKILAVIFDYSTAVEEVYMEVGLQTGAIISAQMLENLKNVFERDKTMQRIRALR